MKKFFFLFFLYSTFSSCNHQQESKQANIAVASVERPNIEVAPVNMLLHDMLTQAPQVFTVATDIVQTITARKGLKVEVDASKLETLDGQPIHAQVEVSVQELLTAKDMMANDCPTVSDGKMLLSGGSFFIGMKSNGKNLRIKKGYSLKMQFPKISGDEMELYSGEKAADGSMNWKPINKKLVSSVRKAHTETVSKQATQIPASNNSKVVYADTDTSQNNQGIGLSELLIMSKNKMPATEFNELVRQRLTKDQLKEEVNNMNNNIAVVAKVLNDSIPPNQRHLKIPAKVKVSVEYYDPVEINNLGWINCDRLFKGSEMVPAITMQLQDSAPAEIGLYYIFKNLNAVLSSKAVTEGKSIVSVPMNAPLGSDIEILFYGKLNNHFVQCRKAVRVEKGMTIPVEFVPVPDANIKRDFFSVAVN